MRRHAIDPGDVLVDVPIDAFGVFYQSTNHVGRLAGRVQVADDDERRRRPRHDRAQQLRIAEAHLLNERPIEQRQHDDVWRGEMADNVRTDDVRVAMGFQIARQQRPWMAVPAAEMHEDVDRIEATGQRLDDVEDDLHRFEGQGDRRLKRTVTHVHDGDCRHLAVFSFGAFRRGRLPKIARVAWNEGENQNT